MTEISQELLDSVHTAGACMVDIRELAGNLAHLSAKQVEPLLLKFVDDGEDRAVSRLLQACAFNGVQLDPTVLCHCIGVCKGMPDSAPCFALQDESAIPPLLAASVAEELSVERKIYAASLAAELTVKFGLDPQPVRKVLWKHEQGALSPHHGVLIAHSLELLEEDSNSGQPHIPLWTGLQLSDLLPEHRPRAIVGGDYTVRRPIPKLGRNEPCHCGSGRKYKKCCHVKEAGEGPCAGTERRPYGPRPGNRHSSGQGRDIATAACPGNRPESGDQRAAGKTRSTAEIA